MSGGAMGATEELVSQLRATLSYGIRLKDAEKVLHSLQDELLVPRGLYLNGGLSHLRNDELSSEIVGLVTRADGRDLSDLDVRRITAWLGKNPAIAEFSMGSLKPANSPDFMPGSGDADVPSSR
jgi:uncharacterized protein YggL (DUF469 family)